MLVQAAPDDYSFTDLNATFIASGLAFSPVRKKDLGPREVTTFRSALNCQDEII